MELVLVLSDGVTSRSPQGPVSLNPIQEHYRDQVRPRKGSCKGPSGGGSCSGHMHQRSRKVPAVETRRLTDFTWIKLDCNGKTSIVPP